MKKVAGQDSEIELNGVKLSLIHIYETLTSRETINTKMRATLDVATDPWGIKVNRVELKNIIPPKACLLYTSGGKSRITIEKPLVVYKEPNVYTDEIYEIYGDKPRNNGK